MSQLDDDLFALMNELNGGSAGGGGASSGGIKKYPPKQVGS
jgi:hypothetical protein